MKRYLYVFSLFFLSSIAIKAQVDFQSSNLPIIIIDTDEQEIPDEPKVFSTLKIIANEPGVINQVTDPANDYDGYAGIELRGQSSQFFDKKSYGLELRTINDEDTSAVVLGLPKEEDWILYGPYSDKSLMRNHLSFYLWSGMGWYGSRTRFCEVVINNDYKGVYVFMEKIKRDGDRVDISTLNPDENTGDDLTGGYIIKVDKTNDGETVKGWASSFPPPNREQDYQEIFFQVEEPDPEDITSTQLDYIRAHVSGFEEALASSQFTDPVYGYRRFINIRSFVDYSLLSEINRNVDSYRLSTYFYKDKDSNDGRLVMGPPWDYNLAFGNADYCDGWETDGWAWNFNQICPHDYWLNPFWWNRFMQDPVYIAQLQERWEELRSGPFSTEAIHAYIDSLAIELEAPQQRNFERWPVLGSYVWPNSYVGQSYKDEIDFLKSWIEARMSWLDITISDLEVVLGNQQETISGIKVYPNPASGHLKVTAPENLIHYRLTDLKGRLSDSGDIVNKSEFLLDISELPQGIYVLKVVDSNHRSHIHLVKKE